MAKTNNDLFRDFMELYRQFVALDLIVSLYPIGRNEKLIREFLEVFIILLNPIKVFSLENREKAINSLKSNVINYIDKHQDIHYQYRLEELERDYSITSPIRLKDIEPLTTYLKEFLFALNKYGKNIILKQPTIEFNNALSHIFVGYFGSDTEINTNVSRAKTHLYRGTLDIYKYVIKEKAYISTSEENCSKVINTYCNKELDKNKKLSDLRLFEFSTIGLEVSNGEKHKIIQNLKYIIT